MALSWAEYRVLEALQGLPESASEKRNKWTSYIEEVLRPSLHDFEAADTVTNRLQATDRLQAALGRFRRTTRRGPGRARWCCNRPSPTCTACRTWR